MCMHSWHQYLSNKPQTSYFLCKTFYIKSEDEAYFAIYSAPALYFSQLKKICIYFFLWT